MTTPAAPDPGNDDQRQEHYPAMAKQTRAAWALAIALALFAVLALPQLMEDTGKASAASGANAMAAPDLPSGFPTGPSGDGSPSATPTPPTQPGDDAEEEPDDAQPQQPQVDPTTRAFRSITPGKCLRNYYTGAGWSGSVPYPTACGPRNVYVRVNQMLSTAGGCTTGTGYNSWTYTDAGNNTTTLCLTREYAAGQCFPAEQSGNAQKPDIRMDGFSGIDCDAQRVPAGNNQVMQITGYHGGGSTGNYCARVSGDTTRYWSWSVLGGRAVICAVIV